MPILEPLDIHVSGFSIEPSGSKTAQEISLRINLESDRSDIFSAPYLLTKFTAGAYQPIFSFMHKPATFVNGVETEFRTIETVDMDLDTTIAALFIDIPEEVRVPSKAIEVRFTGFKNPNYVN